MALLLLAAFAAGKVTPNATALAAGTRSLAHLPGTSAIVHRPPGAGWIMTRPDISVSTRMVIPQNTVSGAAIAQYAIRYLGFQYTLTGNSPLLGFSCIGFVSYVYQSLGIPLPDDLWNARAFAPAVPYADLRPGDILWFGNTVWAGLSHTGIYLGHGNFVHAAWYNLGVIMSSFRNDPRYGNYWTTHYLGASRPWGGWGSRTPSFAATLARYLYPPMPDAVLPGGAILVHMPEQRIRRWWSLQAPVVRIVAQATPLIPLSRSGDWYQVMTPDGVSGWVLSRSRLPVLAEAAPVNRVTHTVRQRTQTSVKHLAHQKWMAGRHASIHRRRSLSRHRSPTKARRRQVSPWPAKRSPHRAVAPRARHRKPVPNSTRSRHHASSPPHAHRQNAPSRRRPVKRSLTKFVPGTAIRFMADIALYAAPEFRAARLRMLRAGSNASVIAAHGQWLYIRLGNGPRGYVQISTG